jgi:hypothetical protein
MGWFLDQVSIGTSVTRIRNRKTPTKLTQTARKYWNKLKERLGKEGSQLVTDCHRLKLPAADGKNYLTDAATGENFLPHAGAAPRKVSKKS